MSDAYYLNDFYDGRFTCVDEKEQYVNEFYDTNSITYFSERIHREVADQMAQYLLNKSLKVGDGIICPVCKRQLVKSSYQQAFCKTKQHKDKFWNRQRYFNHSFKYKDALKR